jgi:hypothetical protein
MTALLLHTSMQITQLTRTVVVGETNMNQLASTIYLSLFMPMMRKYGPVTEFFLIQ